MAEENHRTILLLKKGDTGARITHKHYQAIGKENVISINIRTKNQQSLHF